jgi:hypothetical protein
MTMASVFVLNAAHATCGLLAGNSPREEAAHATAERLGQGDPIRFFASIGEMVEREHGTATAERVMHAVAVLLLLVEMAGRLDAEGKDDLVNFMIERIRHNQDRLFGCSEQA